MRKGFKFKPYKATEESPFEKLFSIFTELIVHTSGDFDEAINWLRELDKEYEAYGPAVRYRNIYLQFADRAPPN